jgi:hypothetical protein
MVCLACAYGDGVGGVFVVHDRGVWILDRMCESINGLAGGSVVAKQ